MEADWLAGSCLMQQVVTVSFGAIGCEWWRVNEPLKELCVKYSERISDSNNQQQVELEGVKELVDSHLRAPDQQQAPARFLALIHTWRVIRENWSRDNDAKVASLEAGISKLREAGERVAKLQEEANKQRQELDVKLLILFYLFISNFQLKSLNCAFSVDQQSLIGNIPAHRDS